MRDDQTTLDELKGRVQDFCEERNWDSFHNAKDLAIGIITEASELLEHFRFRNEKEIRAFFKDPKKKREITEELIDVLFPLLRFSQIYKIDLTTEMKLKMKKNARKYPVAKKRSQKI